MTLIGNALTAGWYPVMWWVAPFPVYFDVEITDDVKKGHGGCKQPLGLQDPPSLLALLIATVKLGVLLALSCSEASMHRTTRYPFRWQWVL